MADKAAMEEKSAESKFSKEQIVTSKRYAKDVDIVMALLEEGKEYTHKEVESIINKFNKKKEVN